MPRAFKYVGSHDLGRVPAGRGGDDAGAAQVGDVIALGGLPALCGQRGRQVVQVELGGDAEPQRLGEVALEDVRVRVDQSGEQGLPGAVEHDVDGAADV
ncbi:hypothetical protein [Nonomuraea sp. NPDC049750]|uniref:hypothetical protein n=1 Tax=Nonomuraea sp. NPDC049750 TaxID=3154738 RepID=UPI0033E1BB6C